MHDLNGSSPQGTTEDPSYWDQFTDWLGMRWVTAGAPGASTGYAVSQSLEELEKRKNQLIVFIFIIVTTWIVTSWRKILS